jgi:hypothetical protein
MIKLNETWSIERHIHGGFNLIETHDKGISKKTNKPIVSSRSYFYPNLKLCAAKMVECGFDNDAEAIDCAVDAMCNFTIDICNKLSDLMEKPNE